MIKKAEPPNYLPGNGMADLRKATARSRLGTFMGNRTMDELLVLWRAMDGANIDYDDLTAGGAVKNSIPKDQFDALVRQISIEHCRDLFRRIESRGKTSEGYNDSDLMANIQQLRYVTSRVGIGLESLDPNCTADAAEIESRMMAAYKSTLIATARMGFIQAYGAETQHSRDFFINHCRVALGKLQSDFSCDCGVLDSKCEMNAGQINPIIDAVANATPDKDAMDFVINRYYENHKLDVVKGVDRDLEKSGWFIADIPCMRPASNTAFVFEFLAQITKVRIDRAYQKVAQLYADLNLKTAVR